MRGHYQVIRMKSQRRSRRNHLAAATASWPAASYAAETLRTVAEFGVAFTLPTRPLVFRTPEAWLETADRLESVDRLLPRTLVRTPEALADRV